MLRGYSLLAAIVNDLLRLKARRGSLRLAASATCRTMLASDIPSTGKGTGVTIHPKSLYSPRTVQRSFTLSSHCCGRDRPRAGAEGATAPETLRQTNRAIA